MYTIKNIRQVLLLLFILVPGALIAQVSVTGKIDDGEQGLPFANVLVLNPKDSSLVKGTITNDNGEFNLENVPSGNFLISASMVGYDKYFAPLKTANQNISLPDIILNESSKELANVVVKADKTM